LDELSATVLSAYNRFDYRTAHLALFDFCNDTLSAVYLAAVKDRLYCDRPDSPRRRRTQATLHTLTDTLCRLLAPILCHTADEAWRALNGVDDKSPRSGDTSVHMETFAAPTGTKADPAWARVFELREQAQLALERAKAPAAAGGLGVENPLDAGVILPDAGSTLGGFDPSDLADLLGVSQVRLGRDPSVLTAQVIDLRDGANFAERCDRSWKRDGTVKRRADGGLLSDRDAAAVGAA
jgi:isoleucyl-tRNA synthetase